MSRNRAELLKERISHAFDDVPFPGDAFLRGSNEGEEPFLLEKEFKGRTDWRNLDAEFLDGAPDGHASALSFFSDEAFRFYLPAYLIADIEGNLERTDPAFYLCYGLSKKSKTEKVNPRRYGDRTWFDEAQHRFAIFSSEQAAAIVAYLEFKREALREAGQQGAEIAQALKLYWSARAS